MCDIPNNLPLTHESLSHHINAQAPPWAEAFTKVPSNNQELIHAAARGVQNRLTGVSVQKNSKP